MKRVAAVAVIAVALAVVAYLYFRGGSSDSSAPAAQKTGFSARTSDPFDAPAPAARGDSSLRGTVVGPDGKPAPGVTVIAVEAEGDALSARECSCDGAVVRGSTMLDCPCRPHDEIIAAVARREGEPQLLSRTLTDDQGAFELSGLAKEPVTLWAQHVTLGVTVHEQVKPDDHPQLILGPPVVLTGQVVDEKQKPLPKTLITVVVDPSSRFFEALSDAQGNFKVGGPLATACSISRATGPAMWRSPRPVMPRSRSSTTRRKRATPISAR